MTYKFISPKLPSSKLPSSKEPHEQQLHRLENHRPHSSICQQKIHNQFTTHERLRARQQERLRAAAAGRPARGSGRAAAGRRPGARGSRGRWRRRPSERERCTCAVRRAVRRAGWERSRSVPSIFWSGMVPDLEGIFFFWSHSVLVSF